MRTPNHETVKHRCRESIPALMRRYFLGTPATIAIDESGWVNPCFFVNDKFVFRFNARDVGLPKFQREKIIFDLIENSTLPSPRSVLLDISRDIAPYDVLISPKLRGTSIEQDWSELDSQTKTCLAEAAGRLLAQLHEVSFPFFGEIAEPGPLPRTDRWIDYLRAKLCLQLDRTVDLDIFPNEYRLRALKLFDSRAAAIDEVKSARLVHDDYHFGNLLHVGPEITGILDFEWSFAGDPLYDYCLWYSELDLWPGSRAPFFKTSRPMELSKSERMRRDVYQMIGNVTLCAEAKLHFPKEEATQYRESAESHFRQLESYTL